MQATPRSLWLAVLPLLALVVSPGVGRADFISTGDGALGDFKLTLTYTPVDATHGTLGVKLENTSPQANGGYVTGFVFNNPEDRISGASLSADNANFRLLGGPGFRNSIIGAPYGQFDLGASTFKSFEGGGAPQRGIAVGGTGTFTFRLTGTDLNTLDEESFVSARSVPPGAGQGSQYFVARFRGFNDGGSEKVPAAHAPEPGALALATLGALGLLAYAGRRLRRPDRKGVESGLS